MAITQTGTTLEFQITSSSSTAVVSSTITVPADAEIVIVGVSAYQGTNNGLAGMQFTKSGTDTSMSKATGGDATNTNWQSAMFYLNAPDTGANKTLRWGWTGAPTDDAHIFAVTFWKGIDTASPVRDSDGVQNGTFPATTPTLTASSGDLIVAFCGWYTAAANGSGSIDSWSNLTELAELTNNGHAEAAMATGSPSGDTTVAASTASNAAEPALVAIVLKPAAAGGVYTLAADAGAYTLTGSDAATTLARTLVMDSATYAMTGSDVTLTKTAVTSVNVDVTGLSLLALSGRVSFIINGVASSGDDGRQREGQMMEMGRMMGH